MSKKYNILGLMSGSSLDGLDIAMMEISWPKGAKFPKWKFLKGETLPFTEQWQSRLQHLPEQQALTFAKTHTYFGHYMAGLVLDFLKGKDFVPDFIASHGHTIYHNPEQRMTSQIGDGGAMAAITGYPVICDFRSHDIAIDGEGTPLAPIADQLLFPGYDFYLNIGGIANISARLADRYIAFDIGPANQVLNVIAKQLDLPYDDDGQLARTGQLDDTLLDMINDFPYFSQDYPKSLDNNWIRQNIFPQYLFNEGDWEGKLNTAVEQLAIQTAASVGKIIEKEGLKLEKYRMFVSGGGAFNGYLLERIQFHLDQVGRIELVIPERYVVEFKEALLMGLMGFLRVENRDNCLSSVTGARRNTVGGAIYQGARGLI